MADQVVAAVRTSASTTGCRPCFATATERAGALSLDVDGWRERLARKWALITSTNHRVRTRAVANDH